MKHIRFNRFLFTLFAVVLSAGAVFAQTTAFSYQGRLSEAGNPVTGTRFFRFTLFDENGAAIPGATVEQSVTVTNGVFNTSLDFGADAFPGAARTLEIAVKINAGDAYTVLNPRQTILSAPYSIKSKTADNSMQLGGINATSYVQQDASGNVSVSGGLTVGGSLTLNTVNAQTQYNLGGNRILSSPNGQNLFVGLNAGRDNTTGNLNTFVGSAAGMLNTTGIANSFFGANSGASNRTGGDNSFFGDGAGLSNVAGSGNSFFGRQAGLSNNAINNSFFGAFAGQNNTTGSDNTAIGNNAGSANANLTNATSIGANTSATQSNSVILGSAANVGIGTTAPKAKLDVTGGNILIGSPGQGIILKSPDGAACRLFSIDNAGAMALTAVACP